ncbi:hypothetical protein M0804_004696 [Polistes exclamans]|nr:hypothetical protein M0804_004696 [Polistes exclamans]
MHTCYPTISKRLGIRPTPRYCEPPTTLCRTVGVAGHCPVCLTGTRRFNPAGFMEFSRVRRYAELYGSFYGQDGLADNEEEEEVEVEVEVEENGGGSGFLQLFL